MIEIDLRRPYHIDHYLEVRHTLANWHCVMSYKSNWEFFKVISQYKYIFDLGSLAFLHFYLVLQLIFEPAKSACQCDVL